MIEVENATKSFDGFLAVDAISFSIRTGEIVGLLGPNGAGKTTTMRMITGYLDADAGSIKIDGVDVKENPVETKRKVGYMPESSPLYPDMIVSDYLTYVAKIEGQDPSQKLPHLAKVCGLSEVMHKNIGELSRGNKQRVGLAHALMADPEILILDEPTSGLDPNQVIQVRQLIKEIGKTRTVIISTHILSEVESLCSRVIIISSGKKVADSPTEQLQERSGGGSVAQLVIGGASAKAVQDALGKVAGARSVAATESEGKVEAQVSLAGDGEIRPQLARACVENGWDLFEMQLLKNSLEDVFRALTASAENPVV